MAPKILPLRKSCSAKSRTETLLSELALREMPAWTDTTKPEAVREPDDDEADATIAASEQSWSELIENTIEEVTKAEAERRRKGEWSLLPCRSSVIEHCLFEYWNDYCQKHGELNNRGEYVVSRMESMTAYSPCHKTSIEILDCEYRVKYVFVSEREQFPSRLFQGAAEYNLNNLLKGKIKPEFQAEAVKEIEKQLSFVPPGHLLRRERAWPAKAVFMKFNQWLAGHPEFLKPVKNTESIH